MKLEDVYSMEELIRELAITVSCGGNLLMNVGPNKDGVIVPIFEARPMFSSQSSPNCQCQERLRQLGAWLNVNGEAIYGSSPWSHQNDTTNSQVWYTTKVSHSQGKVVYGLVLTWPESGLLEVSSPVPGDGTSVSLLGWPGPLQFSVKEGVTTVELPDISNSHLPWAWTVKFTQLANGGNSVV